MLMNSNCDIDKQCHNCDSWAWYRQMPIHQQILVFKMMGRCWSFRRSFIRISLEIHRPTHQLIHWIQEFFYCLKYFYHAVYYRAGSVLLWSGQLLKNFRVYTHGDRKERPSIGNECIIYYIRKLDAFNLLHHECLYLINVNKMWIWFNIYVLWI